MLDDAENDRLPWDADCFVPIEGTKRTKIGSRVAQRLWELGGSPPGGPQFAEDRWVLPFGILYNGGFAKDFEFEVTDELEFAMAMLCLDSNVRAPLCEAAGGNLGS